MVAEEIITAEKLALNPVGQKAVILIGEYLGKYTADIYQNFYKDKDDATILGSVNELLIEVVGADKTSQLMADRFGDLSKDLQ